MKIGLEYIKYRWKAKGRHGIHSPFVYDITDKCLKTLIDSDSGKQISSLFKSLRNNHKTIEVQDFGAGSKRLSNKRKISSIFATSSSKGRYGALLYKLAKHYKPKQILEFGTSLGVGTIYLKLGNPESEITTVEACSETRKCALSNFGELNLDGIASIHSTFDDYLKQSPQKSFDMVFVDGHHDGKALLKYMDQLESITHDETMFILDDIRWSSSMLSAWDTIIADNRYHVTLDFFRFGIVLRRPQQEKEHFFLRL